VTQVHVVVPEGVDDPRRPSGGNTYDRRVCAGLRTLGWVVQEHRAAGRWPRVDLASRAGVATALDRIQDGSLVLLDGLVASVLPEVLRRHAGRLRLVLLMHMPLDEPPEREVVSTVAAIVVTSEWTKRWLAQGYGAPAEAVHVVTPGADPARISERTGSGRRLLSVGALSAVKGQDVLVTALAAVRSSAWTCLCVGSSEVEPRFAADVRRRSSQAGLDHRITFTGALTEAELAGAYATADLLLVSSRSETYGMVVTEALARGIPAIATHVGGVSEALGRQRKGALPGLLVPPDNAEALAFAVRRWLTDPRLRSRLRAGATSRRQSLTTWTHTSSQLSEVLHRIAGAA
jgi:glycosyltransferase involved in cell wall biosynthesis